MIRKVYKVNKYNEGDCLSRCVDYKDDETHCGIRVGSYSCSLCNRFVEDQRNIGETTGVVICDETKELGFNFNKEKIKLS